MNPFPILDKRYTYRGKTPDLPSKNKQKMSLSESYFNYFGVLFFTFSVKRIQNSSFFATNYAN